MLLDEVWAAVDPQISLPRTESNHAADVPASSARATGVEHYQLKTFSKLIPIGEQRDEPFKIDLAHQVPVARTGTTPLKRDARPG